MYVLVWQTMDLEQKVEKHTKRFHNYDRAVKYAESEITPEVNGRTVPNVELESAEERQYERGMYWFSNNYAVILNTKGVN